MLEEEEEHEQDLDQVGQGEDDGSLGAGGTRKRLCFSVFSGVAFFFFVRCFAGRCGVLPPSGTDKQESHQTSLLKGGGGRVLFCSKYEFNDFPPSYSSLRGRAIIMMTIRHPYILNRNRTIPLSINY